MTTLYEYLTAARASYWQNPMVAVSLGIVEWLCFLVYISPLPRRERKSWQRLTAAGLGMALCIFLQLQNLILVLHFVLYQTLWSVYLIWSRRNNRRLMIFQNCIFCLGMELCKLFCRDGFLAILLFRQIRQLPQAVCNLIFTVLYMGLLFLVTWQLRRKILLYEQLEMTWPQQAALLFPLLLYLTVRQVAFLGMNEVTPRLWILLILLQVGIAACAEIGILLNASMLQSQIERRKLLEQKILMEKQQQQYLIQKESMEAVNKKYHDLKHYLAGMQAMLENCRTDGQNERLREWLDAFSREIEPFESLQKTGNEVLDILLAERIRECQKKQIRLVPYVDGRNLGFLETPDLCALFGNAMDNAIEATEQLTYVNMKEIHVRIGVSDDLLLLCFQNYYEGTLQPEGEGYHTAKKDAAGHGYGLANIRDIAAKYGGTVACETENGEFILNILLPLPAEFE